jgi:hypothetical protein
MKKKTIEVHQNRTDPKNKMGRRIKEATMNITFAVSQKSVFPLRTL